MSDETSNDNTPARNAKRWRLLWRAALSGFVAAGLLVSATGLLVPSIFHTKALLVFPTTQRTPTAFAVAGEVSPVELPVGGTIYVGTYEHLLRSNRTLLIVARQLVEQGLLEPGRDEALVSAMQRTVTVRLVNADLLSVTIRTTGAPPLLAKLGLRGRKGLYRTYNEHQRLLGPELMRLLTAGMDRVAEEISLDRSKTNRDTLATRFGAEELRLEQYTDRLSQALTEAGIADVAALVSRNEEQLGLSLTELARVGADLAEARQLLATVRQQTDQLLATTESLGSDSPLLQRERENFQAAKKRVADLATRYGPENAELMAASADLRAATERLRQAANPIRRGLDPATLQAEQRVQALTQRRAELLGQLTAQRKTVNALPARVASLTASQRAVTAQQQIVDELRKRLLAADLEYEHLGVRWSYLDEPLPPLTRTSPALGRLAILGFFAGIVLASWSVLLSLLRQVF